MNTPDARELFLHVLDLPSEEEATAFLEQACGEDEELRREVDVLLQAHRKAGGFLGGEAATNSAVTFAEEINGELGPYKLLQRLGEGGMGVVFMAEQQQPLTRMVAVKIIKPGMDSKQVIARFEAERQALAMMDHPHIAKVLDAGTTEAGNPYFAMELVKGIPITKYCDENRLSIEARLKLFAACCEAIQHAHHKGIIHRDLKPSNILAAEYDGNPVPKIIDFGVAKAINQKLTERTMFTQYGQLVGTVDYMAPEQARFNQLDVDTRSDVYSLGVLLYELLTGETPFDKQRLRIAEYEELMDIIRNEDPPAPSSRLDGSPTLRDAAADRGSDAQRLPSQVRGELDWIVMKALEKDRSRRYESPIALARDVERFLVDDPVAACPPSTTYRLRKIWHRHRREVTVAVTFAVVLFLGLIGTGWGLFTAMGALDVAKQGQAVAEDARATAQKERGKAKTAEQEALKQSQANRRTSYLADMRHVGSLWDHAGSPKDIERLLSGWIPCDNQPDLRDFAWRVHWTRLFDAGSLYVPKATAIAISPKGNLITADQHGIHEWSNRDSSTQRWVGSASSTTLSPDGRWAIVRDDSVRRLLNLVDGEVVDEVSGTAVGFSGCGQYLWSVLEPAQPKQATVPKKVSVQVRELSSSQVLHRIEVPGRDDFRSFAYEITLASDGRSLLSRTKANLLTFNVVRDDATSNGKLAIRLNIYGSAWSSDRRMVAFGGESGILSLVTDIGAPEEARVDIPNTGDKIFAVAFSPDSRYLAAGAMSGSIRIWDLAAATNSASGSTHPVLFKTLRGHLAHVKSLVFSSGGLLASLDGDLVARLWNVTGSEDVYAIEAMGDDLVGAEPGITLDERNLDGAFVKEVPSHLDSIEVGDQILTINGEPAKESRSASCRLAGPLGSSARLGIKDESGVRYVDVERSKPRGTPWSDCIRYSSDGKTLVVADPFVGATLIEVESRQGQRLPIICAGAAFSANDQLLALAGWTQLILYDRHYRLRATLDRPVFVGDKPGGRAAFSPDGSFVAMTVGLRYDDRPRRSDVIVWDIRDLGNIQKVFSFTSKNEQLVGVAFTPDGEHMLATDHEARIRIWNTNSWKLREEFSFRHSVRTQALSPDGNTLACAADFDKILIFDMRTHQLHYLNETMVREVAFTSRGRTLISVGARISIWDVHDRSRVTSFGGSDDLDMTIDVAPNDQSFATAGSEGRLRIWQVRSLEEIDQSGFTIRSLLKRGKQLSGDKRLREAISTLRKAQTLAKGATNVHDDLALEAGRLLGTALTSQQAGETPCPR